MSFSKLSCWLIGAGAWGRNIQRTLESLRVGYLRVNGEQPLQLDAVFIATPLSTHAKIALPLIERGIPVFLEKPLCSTHEEGLAFVRAWWGAGAKTPLLCDFQHVFSGGFSAVMEELATRKPERISFVATLGGPGPTRADCNPVWDYGSHLVAMALQLGLKGALMQAVLLYDGTVWTIEGPPNGPHQIELNVSNQFPDKARRATIAFDADIVGNYSEPIWLVHRDHGPHAGAIERYSNEEDPPLRAAIEAFLLDVNATKTVLGPRYDSRFGLSLPLEVDAVLRRLISP